MTASGSPKLLAQRQPVKDPINLPTRRIIRLMQALPLDHQWIVLDMVKRFVVLCPADRHHVFSPDAGPQLVLHRRLPPPLEPSQAHHHSIRSQTRLGDRARDLTRPSIPSQSRP